MGLIDINDSNKVPDPELAQSDQPGNGAVRLTLTPPSALSLALSSFLLSGLFALMLWTALPRLALIMWLVVAATLAVLEMSSRLVVVLGTNSKLIRQRWQSLIDTLDIGTGLLWLYAALFFFPATQSKLQFFFLFALALPALCTAVYQHNYLPTCFARIGLALPVAALQLVSSSASLAVMQALIVVGIWASIMWLAVRLHDSFLHRLNLTNNRDALLKKVADNARDLDALRTMEAASRERAESANLAKSRFLAHSSHDLRQPLHAISLLLETVDEDRLDQSTGHVIARVRQSVELLAKLFDSLLDLTLLDTGQIEIDEIVFDIDSVFDDVAGDFASVAEANSVVLEVERCGLFIKADPTITRRMIQNLVANAIRHAPGGRVTLRANRGGNVLVLEIEDTGSGIAVEDQQRIFDEFTRLDTSASTRSAGSLGLGLAIVNRLARLTGVAVEVSSELNCGSLFSIGPFEVQAAVDRPLVDRLLPVPDLRHVHVVVVDDDADTLRATGKLLNKWGLGVTLLEIGDVEKMPRPDILVCDYELGGVDTGIDVVRRVREMHGEAVPALLVSGNTSPDLARRAQREDLRLLHKPVRPAQLKSAILTLLGTVTDKSSASASSQGK